MDAPDLSAFGYEVVESLGEGATSTVYLARQTKLANRFVAIKAMRHMEWTAQVVERERHVAGVLEHTNVLRFIDAIDVDGRSYLVMEYAAGGTESGPLDADRVIAAGIALADALATAHDLGIVHSDVKPSNILWTERGEPRLADFGTARVLEFTAMRDVLGFTPGWAPPSVRVDGTDPMTDVWSLSASLASLASGSRPPDLRWDLLDADLRAVLGRAMADDQASMTMTAKDLRDELQHLSDRRRTGDGASSGDASPVGAAETVLEPGGRRGSDGTTFEEAASWEQRTAQGTGEHSEQPAVSPHRRRGLVAAAAGLSLLVIAVIGWSVFGPSADDQQTVSSARDTTSEPSAPAESAVADTTTQDIVAPDTATEAAVTTDTVADDAVTEGTVSPGAADDRFVFASDRAGAFALYELATSSASPIGVETGVATSPSLSPDATSIVFAQTGGIRSVVLADLESGASTQLSPAGVDADEPALSPDGAFVAWVSRENGNRDIVLYEVSTGVSRFVTTSSADDRSPAWSPDGQALVFRSDRSGNGDIYVLTLSSQTIEQRTDTPDVDDHPAMAADGRIAFERRVSGDVELFEVAGGVVERVTTREGFDGYPVYSNEVLFYVADDGSTSWIQTPGGGRLGESSGVIRDLAIAYPQR